MLGMQTMSEAALEWLVSNKVIKREQRYDAAVSTNIRGNAV
jgi:hypothetical protein